METTPYQPIMAGYTLAVLENGVITTYQLASKAKWTFGRRTPQNQPDISVNSQIVGREHGEFLLVDGILYYCDKGSKNGTFINGKKPSSGFRGTSNPIELKDGDILRIDYADFSTPDSRGVLILVCTSLVEGTWTFFALNQKQTITIGRDAEKCDIVLSRPYVSAVHSKISYLNNSYYVSDCSSLEGTWLNGKKIDCSMLLNEKDQIAICDFHLVFTKNGIIYNRQSQMLPVQVNRGGKIVLKADIKSKKVPSRSGQGKKELLRDIHLEIESGQLIALLGSSGSGKTTLMNCMSGMEQSGVVGTITFLGEDLYSNFDRLKRLIGYVPQSNVVRDLLHVEEELKNAAIMRLPKDADSHEIAKQVDRTLKELNLLDKRKTQIKKLSGGECKRVNIGIELVADRKILFLDEPDAGLDPQFKEELFGILRQLAHKSDKSVIAIIHDVSKINLFDRVIMMLKKDDVGRLAFYGSPEDSLDFFHVQQFQDIYSAINSEPEKFVME